MVRGFLKTFLLYVSALLLLSIAPIAYASGEIGAASSDELVHIEVADPSSAASAIAFGKAVGSFTPGDLFYIDTQNSNIDLLVTLHITNASELFHHYRYMVLKIGVYTEGSNGEWGQIPSWIDGAIPDIFITLRNGYVSFPLAGYAKYKITVDEGNFFCTNANANEGALSPKFYLATEFL